MILSNAHEELPSEKECSFGMGPTVKKVWVPNIVTLFKCNFLQIRNAFFEDKDCCLVCLAHVFFDPSGAQINMHENHVKHV